MNGRTALRVGLSGVVLVAASVLGVAWVQTPTDATVAAAAQMEKPLAERAQVVDSRNGTTVVTTDPPGGTDGRAAIVAFDGSGRPLYYNDTYGNYFDVDPDPPGSKTVLYVAGSRYDQCPPALNASANGTFADGCAEVAVERVNLTTGETERLHTAVTAWDIWHDVDRIDDDRLLVADIARDRALVLNTTTDAVEWEWNAESALDPESGGQAGDWTHINDVERLPDGRIMVSLRNQDRVAFLTSDGDLEEYRTLGAEDAYAILYEQHNPDYIPSARGGPAVIVADSENNRVVEYQSDVIGWERTWQWTDEQLRWPRDADRLPGGHTLVTDSQGNRVIELDETDEIVWHLRVSTPYEAERLGTGDESATGHTRTALAEGDGIDGQAINATGVDPGPVERAVAFVTGPVVNGVLYVAPPWMTVRTLLAAAVFCSGLLVWGLLELYWSRFSLPSVRS